METFFLNQPRLDWAIEEARRAEELDARLSSLLGADADLLNRSGLIERLPSGLKNTGKMEGYLRGLLYGGQMISTEIINTSANGVSPDGSGNPDPGSNTFKINPPSNATYCEFFSDDMGLDSEIQDPPRLRGRYLMLGDSVLPTNSVGYPALNPGIYRISFPINMLNFRLFDGGSAGNWRVVYYG